MSDDEPKWKWKPYEVTVTKLPTMVEQADFREALRRRLSKQTCAVLPRGTRIFILQRSGQR